MKNRHRVFLTISLLVCTALQTTSGTDLHVFFVGNSLTDGMQLPTAFRNSVTEAGHGFNPTRTNRDTFAQIVAGAPLSWHWYEGGYYNVFQPKMTTQAWDVLVLQPFDRRLLSWSTTNQREEGDVAMCGNFIDLMIEDGISPDVQVYIYAHWPRGGTNTGFDFATLWDSPVDFTAWGQADRRMYFEALTDHLRTNYAGRLTHEPKIIPVGDVLYEINARLQTNPQPGPGSITYTNVQQLYGDNVHLKPGVGRYVMAMTTLATLYRQDPRGLSDGLYNTISTYYPQYTNQFEALSPEMRVLIQEAAWDVVSNHPYAGVLLDRDGDGMGDAWEWIHFGGAEHADPTTDDDNDGHNNLAEYITGTAPTNPLSVFSVNIENQGDHPNLSWPHATGRTYHILATTNLLIPFQLIDTVTTSGYAPTPASELYRYYQIGVSLD